jgi:hypothetical protein
MLEVVVATSVLGDGRNQAASARSLLFAATQVARIDESTGSACNRDPDEPRRSRVLVYRVRRAPDMQRGDLLIIEPRNTAATGELVIAFQGPRAYVGHWWAKHGLRELRSEHHEPITGDLQIAGAVNAIVRTT